jgi:hypothetical protein
MVGALLQEVVHMARTYDRQDPEPGLTDEERERIRAEERERARREERERVRAEEQDRVHAEERDRREDREDREEWERRRAHDEHDGPVHRDEEHRHDPEHRHDVERRPVPAATRIRGGLSLGSILTGMAVALGAMFLLTALVGGIAVAVGLADGVQPTPMQVGWGLGIALVISQFLAYLWGGYSAGRMARGAGLLNGLMVPVVALLLVGLVGAIVAAFGVEVRFVAPFTALQIPVEQEFVVTFGIGLGIATLVAMFVGAVLGGAMGSRWHDKLEAAVVEDRGYARAA